MMKTTCSKIHAINTKIHALMSHHPPLLYKAYIENQVIIIKPYCHQIMGLFYFICMKLSKEVTQNDRVDLVLRATGGVQSLPCMH